MQEPQAMNSNFREDSWKIATVFQTDEKTGEVTAARKDITSTFQESTHESGEHSQSSWWQSAKRGMNCPQSTNTDVKKCEFEEHSQDSLKQQWCELGEVVESDFLISPGDVLSKQKGRTGRR